MRLNPMLSALLINAILIASLGSAHAVVSKQQVADRIANFIQGRFVINGGTIYYAAKASAKIEGGKLILRIDADPLYNMKNRSLLRNQRGGITLYQAFLPENAKCGLPELGNRLDGTNIRVKKGGRFLNLREAMKDMFPKLPSFSSTSVATIISDDDLKKIRSCAKKVAAKADAKPFETIQIYSKKSLLTEVARTTEQSRFYEHALGDNNPITHIIVQPKTGKTEGFSVSIQAVSVMHCDYEGPHIELDNWKQGLSVPKTLLHKGNVFYVAAIMPNAKLPKFPAYTQTKLRQAIRTHFGGKGLASVEEAKPCAPYLRGYRFIVKYGLNIVQEISVYTPGGC